MSVDFAKEGKVNCMSVYKLCEKKMYIICGNIEGAYQDLAKSIAAMSSVVSGRGALLVEAVAAGSAAVVDEDSVALWLVGTFLVVTAFDVVPGVETQAESEL